MIRAKGVEAVAWALAVGAVLASAWEWTRPMPDLRPESGFAVRPVARSRTIDVGAIHRSATVLRDRNPFRVERRPTMVRFGSAEIVPAAEVEVVETPADRPNLVLAGIVGGPPWIVLVEGIPGRESGIILVEGEETYGFRLERVHGDTAVISGLDTTWVLLPKRVWR
ncbi:MAG TPA: hypothetical protein VF188_16905 [Longimicrobiales bacterium]